MGVIQESPREGERSRLLDRFISSFNSGRYALLEATALAQPESHKKHPVN
jgi:hypothetical protein